MRTLTPEPSLPDASPSEPLAVDVRAITKSYPGNPPVRALRGVDLAVAAGELVGIVGPSGSGKSTLLHVLGTLDRPTSGHLAIAGHTVFRDVEDATDDASPTGLSERDLSAVRANLIGFVFQQFHLLAGMSVLDNVATGLLYTGQPARLRRVRAAEALVRVGLQHRLAHQPNELSGGERQRVAIARAVVNRPSIVLADEPTGNLDTRTSGAILDLLLELHDAGSTIVVITHDLELARQLPREVRFRDGLVEHDSGARALAGVVR